MSAKKTTGSKPASTTPKATAKKAAPKKAATPRVAKPKPPKPTLDATRLAFVVANARPALAPCLCGCGATTKGRFFPGCDAKLKALLKNTDDDQARAALATFGW